MRRSFFSNRSFKFILGGLVFLFVLLIIQKAYVQPPPPPPPISYSASAHGNTLYGVNRPRTSIETGFGYSRGNCAHCHEQHASIGGQTITPQGYELFYDHWINKCNLFCYRCHQAASEQSVINYLYAYNFGGDPTAYYSYIYDQFCANDSEYATCGSRHNLGQIRNVLEAQPWGYLDDPDPCSACHNPHLVQKTGSGKTASYNPNKSLISRPTEHTTKPLNLWGDNYQSGCTSVVSGQNERMICYAQSVSGHYQALYYGSNPSATYEPAANTIQDGSNLPDYVTFCLDCHKYQTTDPESGESVKEIVWDNSADGAKHGGVTAGPKAGMGGLRAPYSEALRNAGWNYVLSCLDCHEPHGSNKRLHLIRRFINGEAVAAGTDTASPCVDSSADWQTICGRCHTNMHSTSGCDDCHNHTKQLNDFF